MHVGTRYFHVMNKPGFPVYAYVRLIAEVPRVAFLRLVRIRIPFLLSVLRGGWGGDDGRVNNGTLLRIKPCTERRPTTCANNFSCRLFFTSSARNRPMVSPSGIWLLESTPQNSEKARLSIISIIVAMSDRL